MIGYKVNISCKDSDSILHTEEVKVYCKDVKYIESIAHAVVKEKIRQIKTRDKYDIALTNEDNYEINIHLN